MTLRGEGDDGSTPSARGCGSRRAAPARDRVWRRVTGGARALDTLDLLRALVERRADRVVQRGGPGRGSGPRRRPARAAQGRAGPRRPDDQGPGRARPRRDRADQRAEDRQAVPGALARQRRHREPGHQHRCGRPVDVPQLHRRGLRRAAGAVGPGRGRRGGAREVAGQAAAGQGGLPQARQRRGRARRAHRRLCAAGAADRRGRQREVGRGARHPHRQRDADQHRHPLAAVRDGGPAEDRRRRRGRLDPRPRPRPGRAADRGADRRLGRGGGRHVPLHRAGRRPDRARAVVGDGEHPHRAGADPGQRHLPQGDLPAAAGGAARDPDDRARATRSTGGVRRLLLPALHRQHPAALAALLRHRARPQRARQPARHRSAR